MKTFDHEAHGVREAFEFLLRKVKNFGPFVIIIKNAIYSIFSKLILCGKVLLVGKKVMSLVNSDYH